MELAGKVIKFEHPTKGIIDAMIVEADPDIGFTLVDANNKYDYLHCYHGDSSVRVKDYPELADPESDKFMWEYLNNVVNGIVYAFYHKAYTKWCSENGRDNTSLGGDPSPENCAFGS